MLAVQQATAVVAGNPDATGAGARDDNFYRQMKSSRLNLGGSICREQRGQALLPVASFLSR